MITLLGLFPALFMPFIGSILSIISSAAAVASAAIVAVLPILQALIQFLIFFVKSFFIGLGVIIQNLNVLSVIIVVVLVTFIYIHHIDNLHLAAQIKIQKNYDASHKIPHVLRPLHKQTPKKTNGDIFDFNIFGI